VSHFSSAKPAAPCVLWHPSRPVSTPRRAQTAEQQKMQGRNYYFATLYSSLQNKSARTEKQKKWLNSQVLNTEHENLLEIAK
jgi:hypothetical protein